MRRQAASTGIAALGFLLAFLAAGEARAFCDASRESGTWVNADAALKQLARLEVRTTCSGGRRGWKVRAATRCARTECTWGYAPGIRRPDGALAALFSTFVAERLVRMSVDRDTMHVAVISIFRGGKARKTVDRYTLDRHYE